LELYNRRYEFANAFTESMIRVTRSPFLDMAKTSALVEDDETPLDEDYLRAMRYGSLLTVASAWYGSVGDPLNGPTQHP